MIAPEDKERLSAEAKSLKSNEAFQKALSSMRMTALEGLASTNATETDIIRDLQATVRVVDELRKLIDAFIRQGQPPKAPGIV